MSGSRKFGQRGPILTTLFFRFSVDEGMEDPNTTISGPSLARQRNDDGPTINAGLVAL